MANPDHPAVDAYFRALGEFIHEFGKTESHLAFMLQRFVSAEINAAYEPFFALTRGAVRPEPLMDLLRALTGSQRSKPLSDIIEAVLRITGVSKEERDEISNVLGHFGHIRFIRDKIAHQGAWPEEHQGGVRWRSSAHGREPKDTKSYYFTVDDLRAATRDLQAVRGRLDVVMIPENPNVRGMVEQEGHYEPWRYKPVQPDSSRGQTRHSRQSPRDRFRSLFQ